MTETVEKQLIKGCEFLLKESDWNDSYGPEDFDEEQYMIYQTVRDFIDQEVRPHNEALEKQQDGLNESLLEKMGELGLLGSHMPEEYGGLDLDFNTNTIIAEEMGRAGGFSVSYNAHTGIGMLPILYFGTDAQKEKYLPKLLTGEWKASYCLTEPSSGSDALSAKTKAILTEDGKHYVLNGQKMWISNAGFADVFTVFAQIDGDKFTGFIIEKDAEGLTLGAEEKKLGIKASSTRQLFLENVKVPVENVLGDIGKGHLIAFNVLNIGRFKLGASCLGGYKELIAISAKYANERIQFKVPISSFGAIQHKLAEQAIQTYVSESSIYRVSDTIGQKVKELKASGLGYAESKLEAAEEYALECSIIKVVGSEVLDYIVDEAVQIHGGMGYSEENPVAQAYRDARINRIFEGTNEINRLLMVNVLMKRAMKGTLDLMTPVMAIQSELMSGTPMANTYLGNYSEEKFALAQFKKCLLIVLGAAAQDVISGKLDLKSEQEILTSLSNIIMQIYNAESVLLRTEKIKEKATAKVDISVYEAAMQTYFHQSRFVISQNAIEAVMAFASDSMVGMLLGAVNKLTKYQVKNVKDLRRKVAAEVIKAEAYCL